MKTIPIGLSLLLLSISSLSCSPADKKALSFPLTVEITIVLKNRSSAQINMILSTILDEEPRIYHLKPGEVGSSEKTVTFHNREDYSYFSVVAKIDSVEIAEKRVTLTPETASTRQFITIGYSDDQTLSVW